MDIVATLVTDPARKVLDASTVDPARRALDRAGIAAGAPDWLGRGIACDLRLGAADIDAARAALRAALAGLPVDVAVQEEEGRRKLLFVADMDATVTEGETIDALAAEAGVKTKIARITARAMRGEMDFPAALRARVRLLKGLSESAVLRVRDAMRPLPGARVLLATLRARGVRAVLVSGGFRQFTRHARDMLGFDEDRGNALEIAGGALTGRVIEPIFGRDGKLETLKSEAARLKIPLSASLAAGDGANDLAMIRAAGLGVAVRAKPVVAAAARARVDHADLTALLYFQGYRRDEFSDA